jgi:hypothetical protein
MCQWTQNELHVTIKPNDQVCTFITIRLKEYYKTRNIEIIYKDEYCSIKLPEDIFEKQDKTEITKFYSKVYKWLSEIMEVPSLFYTKHPYYKKPSYS